MNKEELLQNIRIHPDKFQVVEILKVVDSNLGVLPGEIFTTLTNLKKFECTHCQIPTLNLNALRNATKLKELLLGQNNIQKLVKVSFNYPIPLQKIDLGNNDITHLDANTFYGLNNLKLIQLNDNKLSTIEKDTFALGIQLSSVQKPAVNHELEIHLDRNIMKTLHIDQDITVMSATRNEISSISCDKALHMVKLNLESNKLNQNSVTCLKSMTSLQILNVDPNFPIKELKRSGLRINPVHGKNSSNISGLSFFLRMMCAIILIQITLD